MFEYVTGPICIIELCVIATNVYAYCRGCYVDDKKKPLVGVQCDKLRRFALAFIHSHSGATGVFRNAFMEKSRGGDFLFTKNTADDIGSFTVVCVVGVLGAINCEYRQTFMLGMCGIVTFLM